VRSAEPRLERLTELHLLTAFESGAAELDAWLRDHAMAAQAMHTARSFVLVRGDAVVGYISLTMGSVRREDAPKTLVRGLPRHPVGMVLIARLAVDRREQGRGLGRVLLAEALRLAVRAGDHAAARLVVVDAIDESALRFYVKYGFLAVPEHPRRLYRRLKDVRASLDVAT